MMTISNWEKFDKLYHLICTIATCILIAHSVSYFTENKDFSFVEYKKYNTGPEYLYPSISLYFHNPFYDGALRKNGSGLVWYADLLQRENNTSAMSPLSYDNVTVNIKQNFLGYDITYSNYSTMFIPVEDLLFDKVWEIPYVSYRSIHGKAITMDIPYINGMNVIFVELIFKKEIFPNKARPRKIVNDHKTELDGFEVLFHLPGQFLLGNAKGSGKWNWPKLDDQHLRNVKMKFNIRNVDMLKQRNKRNDGCYEDFSNHDQLILDKIMAEANCRPFYTQTTLQLPVCNLVQLRKHFDMTPNDVITQFDPPCQSMTKVQFDFEDVYDSDFGIQRNNESKISIGVDIMDQLFNQVEQTSAYNLGNLVGDIGGYLGLFLGYAILNIPATLLMLTNNIKTWVRRYQKKNRARNNQVLHSIRRKIVSSQKDVHEAIIENCMAEIKVIIAHEVRKKLAVDQVA